VVVAPYISEAVGARLLPGPSRHAWLTEATHQTAVLVQGRVKPREARAGGSLLPGKMGLLMEHRLVRESYGTIAARVGLPVATVGRLLAACTPSTTWS